MKIILYLTLISPLFFYHQNSIAQPKIGLGSGIAAYVPYVGGIITMPIKLDGEIMLEPYFGFNIQDEDEDRDQLEYTTTSRESQSIGLSVYRLNTINQEFNYYFGANFGIYKYEYNTTRQYESGSTTVNYNDTTKSDYYQVTPLFGFIFKIRENLMFSIDTGVTYSWGKDKHTSITNSAFSDSSQYTNDVTDTSSITRLIYRFLF